ncbi:MAG: hypothetical protein J7525_00945 [Roseofilum sp. SID3]|uniref:hypothetical protein n=1 Tax=unclassified Roseofilum TaxID=2620099 RepID=UPI001B14DBAC|nr:MULTISPECIES: hypothetical protein [unclassified Roseofilum]MBP0011681.1 hypothetical protein [Roseofilum sp. SID3]MBP0036971.1 hypothetical protein [Roseofilum sp. SID1]
MSKIKKGSIVKVRYEERDFDVIVIDPDGLGNGQPTVGVGFRMIERYSGVPSPTLTDWLTKYQAFEGDRNNQQYALKPPSGNTFRVIEILAEDNNQYLVVELSDWATLIGDVLKKPGKIQKATKTKLIDFLTWFAAKGLYADAYTVLKGQYTAKDSRVLSAWMEARIAGKRKRNKYTDFLQGQGCVDYDYAYWTDYVYMGLFGKRASDMRRLWEVVEGDSMVVH